MSLPAKSRFDPSFAITEDGKKAAQLFRDYLTKLDALVIAMAAGNMIVLTNAANDAAAAAAGVSIGQFYRNGSVIMQRQV